MSIPKIITKFKDLPRDIQARFGKERSKDVPAMFISAHPRDFKRLITGEIVEDIDKEFFGDDAFEKGHREWEKLSTNKTMEIDLIIEYRPSKEEL